MSYDPATVRAMLREMAGAAWAAAAHERQVDATALDSIASRILAAHPAPSTPEAQGAVSSARLEAIRRMVRRAEVLDANGDLGPDDVPGLAEAADLLRALDARRSRRSASPTPAPSELHEHCVRMAMEAYDSLHADDPEREERHVRANEMRVRFGIAAGPTERERFLAAIHERLAQSAQVAACNLATNKDAAELLSAAEWLDTKGLGTLRVANVSRWDFGPRAYNRASLPLAILAAARSLGWEPGGGK